MLNLVSRLPPELLSIIFYFVRDTRIGLGVSWIPSVSHICHRWRTVALNCPSLWAELPFNCPPWVDEMLARSHTAPLTMITYIVHTHTYSLEDKVQVWKLAITRNHSRIKQLSWFNICPYTMVMLRDLIKLFDKPMPLLETFAVCFSEPHILNKLPNILKDSSRLMDLTVSNCGMDWQSLSFTVNMRSFSLGGHIPGAYRLSSTAILVALAAMPRLGMLTLTYTMFTSDEVNPSSSSPTATLSCLESLQVALSFRTCVFLLDHIVYPATSKVKIQFPLYHESSKSDDVAGIQRLSNTIRQRLPGPIVSLTIGVNGLSIYTSPSSDVQLEPHVTMNLLHSRVTSHMIAAFLRPLTLLPLESLTITSQCLQMEEYLLIFGDLPHLRTIEVADNSDEFLFALSSGTPPFSSPGDGTPIRFQALRHLTLLEWALNDDPEHEMDPMCVQQLISCWTARKTSGIGLETLILKDCIGHVQDGEVEELRRVVGHVEWDGLVNYTTEAEEDEENDDE